MPAAADWTLWHWRHRWLPTSSQTSFLSSSSSTAPTHCMSSAAASSSYTTAPAIAMTNVKDQVQVRCPCTSDREKKQRTGGRADRPPCALASPSTVYRSSSRRRTWPSSARATARSALLPLLFPHLWAVPRCGPARRGRGAGAAGSLQGLRLTPLTLLTDCPHQLQEGKVHHPVARSGRRSRGHPRARRDPRRRRDAGLP